MSYDLNILCMNQKKPTKVLPNNINIIAEIKNNKDDDNPKYYAYDYYFMNNIRGFWYYLMAEPDEISSFALCDMNLAVDSKNVKKMFPYWCKKRGNAKADLEVFNLRQTYKQDVLETMKIFIKESPVKTILFHSRYQSGGEYGEPEFIYGSLNFSQFVDLLEENKILFNICYIIRDDTL